MIKMQKKLLIILSIVVISSISIFSYNQFLNKKVENVSATSNWLSGYTNRKMIRATQPIKTGALYGNVSFGTTGKIDTAASFDGNGDYITFPDSDDYSFGTGDFTIDFWIKRNSVSNAEEGVLGQMYDSSNGNPRNVIMLQADNKIWFYDYYYYDGTNGTLMTNGTISDTNWHHVAFVRSSGTLYAYIDGAASGSKTWANSGDNNYPMYIGYGRTSTGVQAYFNGLLDEVRISNGVARWTTTFTPSTTAYTADSYDKLLLHFDEASGSTSTYSGAGANTLTNYQVKVPVTYASGMNADFSDLRFTSSDGTTLLDYWIESSTASTSAVVWVEIPTIVDSAKIYMYYGKSDATTVSNGTNTFPLFDDFSGDLSKWTTGGGGTVAISSGRINFSGGTYTNNTFFKSNTTFPFSSTSGYAVELKTWESTIFGIGWFWACGFFETLTTTSAYNTGFGSTYSYGQSIRHTGASIDRMQHIPYSGVTTYTGTNPSQDGDVSINLFTASAKMLYNDTQINGSTSSTIAPTASLLVGCTNYDAGSGSTYGGTTSFDAIFVRKYIANEPLLSIGSAETGTSEETDCVSTATVTCTQTIIGVEKINKYTLSGTSTGTTTWTPPSGVTSIEYLVVAGGGSGGGEKGGGGGAGGYRTNYEGTPLSISSSAFNITVGAGGAGVASGAHGLKGSDSILTNGTTTITATGGGGGNAGGGGTSTVKDGGSGGGGAWNTLTGGLGNTPSTTPSQGYDGGDGSGSSYYCAGGGGGAGGAGADAVTTVAGAGGVGLSNSITGVATYYAGGGGGGSYGATGGAGGSGVGGAGGNGGTRTVGTAGTAHTGSGGGGGGELMASGAGGSGIVIIRYSVSPVLSEITAVTTPTADTTPDYIFSSTSAGTITYGGSCSSATTTATVGNNTITFNTLTEGTYSDCTIKVTDSSSVDSNTLTVTSFTVSIAAVDNSCWYCDYYYDESNVLKTGKNGALDFSFTYQDPITSATLSGYRIAIDTENLSLSNIDSQADVIVPNTSTWVSSSAARGTTVTNSQISVKETPNASLYQIGYGTGSARKLYYWWVKLKNSNGVESGWIPGPSFYTPKKHYPVVRIVADKEIAAIGTDIQFCAGTDLTDQTTETSRDSCYSTCWKGTPGSAVVAIDNTDWECSICYNSSNQPVSCTDPTLIAEGKTNFEWRVPSGYVAETDYSYQSSTSSTSANPIIKFNNVTNTLRMVLSITGSEC